MPKVKLKTRDVRPGYESEDRWTCGEAADYAKKSYPTIRLWMRKRVRGLALFGIYAKPPLQISGRRFLADAVHIRTSIHGEEDAQSFTPPSPNRSKHSHRRWQPIQQRRS